ncbi:PQQ-binding-like beta-propeller repeat protein [Maritimibacter sp. 55A14]|uniref:outer membrane protein assembly factor BamB family protein n=1 Tax=Maritimibacter sp. 55A14 TaxID=2174844 RepID=UPI001E603932|nr:PQQ-binding-like beta-propeller repeat protein [Maritimibacter sp. 55A14]
MRQRPGIAAAVLLLALAACGDRDVILRGEREEVRAGIESGAADAQADRAAPISLPAQVNHAAWTHRNGTPEHRIDHPALRLPLEPVWSASIGTGDTRKHRITAAPVISGGRIFTLDARALVTAHSTDGARLWSVDLTPHADKPGDASGGALTVAGNRLYVTTGFGALYALDPATGARVWEQKLDAAVTGSVTVSEGVVYTVSRDGRAWALDAGDGRIRWEQAGVTPQAVVTGGAGPAVSDGLVVFPFGSGDVVTMLKKNGIRLWQAGVSGGRLGLARSNISDITGDPVIDRGRVYIGNQAGKLVAFDLRSGARLWTADTGAMGPVWPAGGSLFVLSDATELLRLDAGTGERIWGAELPGFVKARRRSRVWTQVYTHYGPVLAGGRVIVASDDGLIRFFDPQSGALTGTTELRGGAAAAPVVVGGRLYIVSERGQLHAFQ